MYECLFEQSSELERHVGDAPMSDFGGDLMSPPP